MTYQPQIDHARLAPLLATLEELRREIGALEVPNPLAGWLRDRAEAQGAHMSTSIEGNRMTEPEVRELFAQDRAAASVAEQENLDYRDAARFARQVADDPAADIDEGLVRALQFSVVRTTDRHGTAGQLRMQQNRVADGAGHTVYLPPAYGDVPKLVSDLVTWLRSHRRDLHHLVLAAVAHLEFVGVHPFDDGNGRTARALTTYFATRGGWNLRGLATTEALFGRDRMRYYEQLQRYQGASYPPSNNDVTQWCVWVLRRLAIEIATAIGIVERWNEFRRGRVGAGWGRGLHEGYMYLALAGSVSRSEYARAAGISPATAVSQLNALVETGGARRTGRGPTTRYVITDDSAGQYAARAYEDAIERFPGP